MNAGRIGCSCSCASSTSASVGRSGASAIAPSGSRGAADCRSRAAREKVRTAHALRELPAISAAFADGRLSYSKVRALTRVATSTTKTCCSRTRSTRPRRRSRSAAGRSATRSPESVHGARHVWERRSLTLFRDRARNCVRISRRAAGAKRASSSAQAVDRAVAAGDAALGVEFASERSARAGARSRRTRSSRSRRRISAAAWQRRGRMTRRRRRARLRRPITIRSWCTSTRKPSAEGRGDRIYRSRPCRRLACDGSVVTIVEDERGTPLDVGPQAAHGLDGAEARALVARPRLHVPGLPPHALRRRASHPSLGGRRRDEPRQHHAALHVSPHAAARGRLHDSSRSCDGAILLPARGRARDSAVRLSVRRRARRADHAGPRFRVYGLLLVCKGSDVWWQARLLTVHPTLVSCLAARDHDGLFAR